MSRQLRCGFLVLDRKGEYIEDTLDQRGNPVFGLQNHPGAPTSMVVVSTRPAFFHMKQAGQILDCLKPQFNVQDIDPIDLADFLPGITTPQADLVRDYAHNSTFYESILAETQFGTVDNRNWFQQFPGLFDLKDAGKKLIKKFEEDAASEGRTELTAEERTQLAGHFAGTKPQLLSG